MSDLADMVVPSQAVKNLTRPLTPEEEETRFQSDMRTDPTYSAWAEKFNSRFGEYPDLNNPEYDTRSAWRHGQKPVPYAPDGGLYHWTSGDMVPPFQNPVSYKQPGHDTLWMQRVMDRTGLDINSVSPEEQTKILAPMAAEDLRQPPTPRNIADMFLPKVQP